MGLFTTTNDYPSRTQTYMDNRDTAGLVQPKESFFPDPDRVNNYMPSTNLRGQYANPPTEEQPPPADQSQQPPPTGSEQPVPPIPPPPQPQGGGQPAPGNRGGQDAGQGRKPKGTMSRSVVEPVVAARNGKWIEDYVKEELPPREANAFKMLSAKDLGQLNIMLSRIKGSGRSADIVGKKMIRRYMSAKTQKFKNSLTKIDENAPEGLFKASPIGALKSVRSAYRQAMREKLRNRGK